MAFLLQYCVECGRRVEEKDVAAGAAGEANGRTYCVTHFPADAKARNAAAASTAGTRRISGRIGGAGGRATDRVRQPRRETPIADSPPTASPRSPVPAIMAVVAVVGLGIAGTLAAMATSGSSPAPTPPNTSGTGGNSTADSATANTNANANTDTGDGNVRTDKDRVRFEWSRRFDQLNRELAAFKATPPTESLEAIELAERKLELAHELVRDAKTQQLGDASAKGATELVAGWEDAVAQFFVNRLRVEVQRRATTRSADALELLERALDGREPAWLPVQYATSSTTPGIASLREYHATLRASSFGHPSVPEALQTLNVLAPKVQTALGHDRITPAVWNELQQVGNELAALTRSHRSAFFDDSNAPRQGREFAYDTWQPLMQEIFSRTGMVVLELGSRVDIDSRSELRELFVERATWWLDTSGITGGLRVAIFEIRARLGRPPSRSPGPQQARLIERQQKLRDLLEQQTVRFSQLWFDLACLDHARHQYQATAEVMEETVRLTARVRQQMLAGAATLLSRDGANPLNRASVLVTAWRFPVRHDTPADRAFAEALKSISPTHVEFDVLVQVFSRQLADFANGGDEWNAMTPLILRALEGACNVALRASGAQANSAWNITGRLTQLLNPQLTHLHRHAPPTRQDAEMKYAWAQFLVHNVPTVRTSTNWPQVRATLQRRSEALESLFASLADG